MHYKTCCPDRCGSVCWASSCKVKDSCSSQYFGALMTATHLWFWKCLPHVFMQTNTAKAHERSPATTIGILDKKIPRCCQPRTLTLWEGRLACLGTETVSVTEGHTIIRKPEIPMSWVMLKKHSNEKGSAQKTSIKWEWFTKEHAA